MNKQIILCIFIFLFCLSSSFALEINKNVLETYTPQQLQSTLQFTITNNPYVINGYIVVPIEYNNFQLQNNKYISTKKTEFFKYSNNTYSGCLQSKHSTIFKKGIIKTKDKQVTQNTKTYCLNNIQKSLTTFKQMITTREYNKINNTIPIKQTSPINTGDLTP